MPPRGGPDMVLASVFEGGKAMADRTNGRGGNRWITAAWTSITALILLAPAVAMQFSDEVNWTVSDFVFAGGLLVGAGVAYELAARVGNLAYQAGVAVALGAGILTMWVTGAVGIIGSEENPGNLLYLAVLALAIAGTIVTGGRPARMVWVMCIVALSTVVVPVIAYAGVAQPTSDVLAPEVFVATGFFAALWLLSAWFFRKAALRAS
jgi:hypothetical protein